MGLLGAPSSGLLRKELRGELRSTSEGLQIRETERNLFGTSNAALGCWNRHANALTAQYPRYNHNLRRSEAGEHFRKNSGHVARSRVDNTIHCRQE